MSLSLSDSERLVLLACQIMHNPVHTHSRCYDHLLPCTRSQSNRLVVAALRSSTSLPVVHD